jgi:hypothetical protein
MKKDGKVLHYRFLSFLSRRALSRFFFARQEKKNSPHTASPFLFPSLTTRPLSLATEAAPARSGRHAPHAATMEALPKRIIKVRRR